MRSHSTHAACRPAERNPKVVSDSDLVQLGTPGCISMASQRPPHRAAGLVPVRRLVIPPATFTAGAASIAAPAAARCPLPCMLPISCIDAAYGAFQGRIQRPGSSLRNRCHALRGPHAPGTDPNASPQKFSRCMLILEHASRPGLGMPPELHHLPPAADRRCRWRHYHCRISR